MLLSASGGVLTLSLTGALPDHAIGAAWRTWWLGDTVGVLLAAPLLLTLSRKNLSELVQRRIEIVAFSVILLFINWVIFLPPFGNHALAFIPVFLTLWAAMRFGISGASISVLVSAAMAGWGTAIGYGPFFLLNEDEALLIVWAYMTTLVVVSLVVTALLAEGRRASAALLLHSQILHNMTEGVQLTRVSDSIIVYTNPNFDAMFGYAPGELIGSHVSRLNAQKHGSQPDEVAKEINQTLRETGNWSGEIMNVKKGGERFWCQASVSTFDHPKLGPVWVAVHGDVTQRKETEAKLINQASLLELAHDSIIVRDMDLRVTFWNSGATARYGWSQQEVLGKVTHDLLQTKFPVALETINSELMQTGRWEGELTHKTKDGQEIVVASRRQIQMIDGVPAAILEINNDITEQKKLAAELAQQAHIDYLTGVLNRRYFIELAEIEFSRSIRYKNQLAILMLDIDFFKRVNDIYGHAMGDSVLKRTTDVCRETLREMDVVGRFGGEEFAILLPQTGVNEAMTVAERLRVAIEGMKVPSKTGLPLQVTVSIGVTSLISQDDNLDTLLDQADKALYVVKNTGRNRVQLFSA